MNYQFTLQKPHKKLMDFLFPERNRQSIKRDLRRHCRHTYNNISMKKKLQLLNYWELVLRKPTIPKKNH